MSQLNTTNYPNADLSYILGIDASGNTRTMGAVKEPQRRVLLYGDSISAANTVIQNLAYPDAKKYHAAEGYLSWANRLLGQRLYLDPALNKGVNGETTAQILARYAADVTANLANFDTAFVQGGTNDVEAGTSAATIISNLQTIINNLIAAGKLVVFFTMYPKNLSYTTAKMQKIAYINQVMRLWLRTRPSAVLVDPWRDLADPTLATGVPAANMTYDGVHTSARGSYIVGRRIYDALNSILPPTTDGFSGAIDAYDATNNPLGNRLPNPAFLTGTGGTITNGSGTLVGSTTMQRYAGTWTNAEVVASVEAPTAGYDAASGNKQVLTVNIASGKSAAEVIQFLQSYTGFSAGDQIYFSGEIDVSGVQNLNRLEAYICESDNTNYPISVGDCSPANESGSLRVIPLANGKLWFRTPVWTVLANSRTFFAALLIGFDATAGAGQATLKIHGLQMRKVN